MKERAWPTVAFWAAALVGLAVLRLPYLSSPLYILDGDEAVMGLMARHLAAGQELPLYFAGQAYGLAIFETLPLALAFHLFGESSHVVALTMVGIFLAGVLGYARAFTNLTGSAAWGRVLALMLALVPGWIVWSTKARGIYVSGFALSAFALAIVTRPDASRRALLGAGLLMGLVGLGQPLWLSITLPLLVLGGRPARDVAAPAVLCVALTLVPALARSGAFWQPRPFEGFMPVRLQFLPRLLVRAFSGNEAPNDPGALATLLGVAGALTFFALIAAAGVDAVRRKSRVALALGVAMCVSALDIVVFRVWVPRYFLPCTVLTVVAAASWIGERRVPFEGARRWAPLALIAVMGFTAAGLNRPSPESVLAQVPAESDIRSLIDGLEADGIQGVYAQSGDIQWQILFYGKERLPARGLSREDRYPRFPEAVERARRGNAPTAYVADLRQLRRDLPTDSFPGYRVGERYLRLDDPDTGLLLVMGFHLLPPT